MPCLRVCGAVAIILAPILVMPPKLGIHSKAVGAVAASMHSMLVERTGGSGQPTFNSAVMAFVDMSLLDFQQEQLQLMFQLELAY